MRKTKPKKHPITPDPKFGDATLTKFVNNLMVDGKKSTAYDVIYRAFDIIEAKTKENPLEIWKKALGNVMPAVEVNSRRIGGSTFQIPSEVRPARKTALGMKWLILYSRKRSGRSMHEKLAAEIMAAANGEGSAVKKREDTHRMAEANKAFSHFRF